MHTPLHLLRTGYRIEDMPHLAEVQEHYKTYIEEGRSYAVMTTKRMPTRSDELLNGGSVYWIIKNMIQCRQKILDVEMIDDKVEGAYCRILLDPQIYRVSPRKKRAIQGWRYLEAKDAPPDIGLFTKSQDDLPPEVEAELREMGFV